MFVSFNPRTHTGCDLFTHLIIVLICSFQSTHPHGVRRAMTLRHRTYVVFQSTHPHGVRPKPSMTVSVYNNGFNPRTHTGCDFLVQIRDGYIDMFQSTHPHGVRLDDFIALIKDYLFQSTHPHGVRLCQRLSC